MQRCMHFGVGTYIEPCLPGSTVHYCRAESSAGSNDLTQTLGLQPAWFIAAMLAMLDFTLTPRSSSHWQT